MKGAPPLRFLAAILGGWMGFRVIVLWPGAAEEMATMPPLPLIPVSSAAPVRIDPVGPAAHDPFAQPELAQPTRAPAITSARWIGMRPLPSAQSVSMSALVPPPTSNEPRREEPPTLALVTPALSYPPLPSPAPPMRQSTTGAPASRWSGSAWLFLRGDSGAGRGLAPGGTLGGSQAGLRLAYRLNRDTRRPLTLSGRVYLPVERPRGSEAALGVDWKPFAHLPVHILAERRERLDAEGRSDFALTLYGGGEKRLLRGRLRLEAYGQAGIVGVEKRDLFADGSVRAGTPIGPLEIGAGAWGGAQPGAARLDVGPQLSARLPLGRTGVRATAEWRFRVAGDAAPGSGPALTVSTDF